MSPRFEYQNQDKPHDDDEQEEDAFPSPNVLLVPEKGKGPKHSLVKSTKGIKVRETKKNHELCRDVQILRSLLHVYRRLFHVVLDRVQNRPLVDDEVRQILEDLGQRGDRFGDFRNLS